MRVGVVSAQVPFVRGGAEIHAETLIEELRRRRIEADLITLPFKWYPPQTILASVAMCRLVDLTESNGRKIDQIIGLKFPAYLVHHPKKVIWVLHQHRAAYDLWDHPQFGDLINFSDGAAVRSAIHYADSQFIPEARAIYATSRNVANRLKRFNNIDARPLYHPPRHSERYYCNDYQGYFFFPSRVTNLKRHHLVIEALGHCRQPVKVVFAGAFESETYKNELDAQARNLGVAQNIAWMGFTTDDEKMRLYADCLAVIYPPIDEDYGYVTLEAMLAHKPVLTTHDAGGPLEFVEDGKTGLVSAPDPVSIAQMLDTLWCDKSRARRLGRAGYDLYQSLEITWDKVIEALIVP
jgi:glycosyltransferase involved in cell wall biosynthesis